MSEVAGALDAARDRLREQAPGPAYLTVQEVAALARCEAKAVRRAIAAGDLTAFRPAKRLLVREDDARGWVESRPALAGRREAAPRGPRPRRTAGSVASLRELERRATDG